MRGSLREKTVVEMGPRGSKGEDKGEKPEEDTETSKVFIGHRLMIA